MATSYLSQNNISLYCIPAAYVICLAPRFYAAGTYSAATKKSMNTKQPRDFPKEVEQDQSLDSKTKGRIVRAEAALANGFENLGFFSAAVVAATCTGVSPWTVNSLSIGYLVSRFAYNHIYIFNDIVPTLARTAAYFAGIGSIMALYITAGNSLKGSLL